MYYTTRNIIALLFSAIIPAFFYAQSNRFEVLERSKISELPSLVKIQEEVKIQDFQKWFKSKFQVEEAFVLVLKSKQDDNLGQSHYRFDLYYESNKVIGANIIAHVKNNNVFLFNGYYLPKLNKNETLISKEEAFEIALNKVKAKQYKWEIPAEEERLKKDTKNPFASYFPKGDIVYASKNGKYTSESYRKCYEFEIYAHAPLSKQAIYVDVTTGEVVLKHDLIHIADQVGTAVTGYSGTQTITANSANGGFTLEESGRGNGIGTYDMQNGTNYNNAVDFTDADNNWSFNNVSRYALDAHWGSEMTYDYFLNKHNRNSIDGNGHVLVSYIHYDVNYGNAFWDGFRMTYGDGSNGNSPFTTLKISGHEITHGLTQNSAGLVYQDESGALNESFSDIFGKSIESYARPNNTNWILGSDLGFVMRNMSNPNQAGDPDTYQGTNWYTGTADNGGVHTNSGVLNFWYYLLTDGGSGTNDIGNNYNVTGIGLDDAGAIAFRTLTVYLTTNSQYQDAYTYSLQAAEDLFGPCSPQLESTHNAWYAVGFGSGYSGAISAEFTQSSQGGCAMPMDIFFTNNSSSSSNFQWTFGDGGTSTQANPTHTYTAPGTYTVSLIVSSNNCGSDTSVVLNAVTVGSLPSPVVQDVNLCSSDSVELNATASGDIKWYDASSGGNLLGQGSAYTTPLLNTNTTYYVEQTTGGSSQTVGALNNTIGNGGFFNGDQHLIFDCFSACTLNSVLVYANGTGNRTIELRDNTGTVLQTTTINIPDGQSRINLNFNIPVGQNLQLGWAQGSQPNLYRNSDGPLYPYTLNGVLSITNSSASQPGYYYCFYDWDVTTPTCSSARAPVNISVAQAPSVTDADRCGTGILNLGANGFGSGVLNWYDAPSGGNLVGTGTSFTTPSLSTTTSYYVEEVMSNPTITGGAFDNTIGTGGYFNGDQHLVFNCLAPTTLTSVKVYADAAGTRTIELRDNTGAVLQTTTVNIPAGESRVALNFNIPVANNLQLGVANGSASGLWRNNTGGNYPYNIGNLITITESSAAAQGYPGYYYFFYDWWVEEPACITSRTEVTATINGSGDATITPVSNLCILDGSITLTAATSGGTWNGNGVNANGVFDPSIGVGTYPITYTLGGGCVTADTLDVIVQSASDATITSGTTFCIGHGNVQLTANSLGGVWSGNGVTDASQGTFNTATAGIGLHTVSYVISGSCGDSSSVSIYVSQNGDASFTVLNSTLCEEDSPITLNPATAGGTWSGIGINQSGVFDPSIAGVGIHTITYDLTAGCNSSHSETIVVEEQANAAINYVGAICVDHAPITVTAATAGGTWIGPGIIDNTAGTFDPATAGVGSHDITYIITGNCGATATSTIEVENCTTIEEELSFGIQLFPNPTKESLSIIIDGTNNIKENQLVIYNVLGEIVFTRTITPIANRYYETFDVSSFSQGVYSVQIGKFTKRFTKL